MAVLGTRRGGRPPSKLGSSLAFKIMAFFGVMVIGLSGVFWYRSIQVEREHLLADAVDYALSLTDLLKKSFRDDMLHKNRPAIVRTLASIAGTDSVNSVRIYNGSGAVAFSSAPAEVGRTASPGEMPCLGCHSDPTRPRTTLLAHQRYTVGRGADGHTILTYVEPILNEPACATAECHAHPEATKVLGVLLAEFPLRRHDERIERQMADFSGFILLYVVALATVGSLILWRVVLRPVRSLSRAVERVAAGDLETEVSVAARDELGRLAGSFNAMTAELGAARRRSERWTQELREEVAKQAAEIRDTEGRLAQAEKLAALGRLTAEIAHEIRNPLTALGGYGRRLQLTVSSPRDREYARIVVDEAARLETLLKDLLDFSRPGRLELRPGSLAGLAGQSLDAQGVRCVERGIVVTTDFVLAAEVPLDHGRARRAVDNLVANAIDAMPGGGTLAVSTREERANGRCFVVLEVADTGAGIPDGDLPRVYEPFWSSKKGGSGTGLGLPITRTIVEAHGGFMRIANRPQGGVVASLWFPADPPTPLPRGERAG